MAIAGVDGLASGIKSGAIIDAFIAADRQPAVLIERRSALYQKRLDGVRSFNTRLLGAQIDAATLKSSGTFLTRTATVSTPTALGVAATTAAVPGSYAVNVKALAAAHQVATSQVASATGANGVGTLTIKAGNGAEKVIALDASNSSLTGIAKAINDANVGMLAQVVNTGSGFKMVVQSKDSGLAHAISKLDGTGDLAALFPSAAGLTQVTAAADARLEIGGPSFSITQSSNTFKDIFPGVTFTAKGVADGVSVAIGTDTTDAKKAINTFVDSINSAVDFLAANASYDKATKTAGVLFSESDLRRGFAGVMQSLLSRVTDLPNSLSNLGAIGVVYDRGTGRLSVDQNLLGEKLAEDPEGVRKLFGNGATSSHSGIQFSTLNEKTKVDADYTVSVTTAAKQAQVASTGTLAASTVITAANKSLALTINGKVVSATLSEGTYTRAELADHLQKVVNSSVSSRGDEVTASISGDAIDLRSRLYGSSQSITVNASSAQTTLALSTTQGTGVDVAGTINNVAATGQGQVLSGAVGSAAEGLRLVVTAGEPVVGATVKARKGIAQLAGELLTAQTNGATGVLPGKQGSLQKSIEDMKTQVTKIDERLASRRERYQAQFLNMEKTIAQYQSQGNALSGQIKGFENFAARRR